MKISDDPSPGDLRTWASDPAAQPPSGEWPLVLSWKMEPGRLRVCIQLASDDHCPQADMFRRTLFEWVSVVARHRDFELQRLIADAWRDQARGAKDPRIKQWRR